MNAEEIFARKLCCVLDQGVREIDAGVAERLRAARECALQHRTIAVESVVLVGAGRTALQLGEGGRGHHPVRTALSILALLLGVALTYYWNAFDQATENEEIDSALLADDLPPNAYLDKGFQAWLEKTSHAAE